MPSEERHLVNFTTLSRRLTNFLLLIDNVPTKCLMPFSIAPIVDFVFNISGFFLIFFLSSLFLLLKGVNFLLTIGFVPVDPLAPDLVVLGKLVEDILLSW